jgi:hypothetical protein
MGLPPTRVGLARKTIAELGEWRIFEVAKLGRTMGLAGADDGGDLGSRSIEWGRWGR